MSTEPMPRAKRGPVKSLPGFVVLEADWSSHLAGKVLQVDADLVATLDDEGVKYRAAEPHEVAIAGY